MTPCTWWFAAVGLVFLSLAVWVGTRLFKDLMLIRSTRSWQRAMGDIRKGVLTERFDADGNIYTYQVEYVFHAEGAEHVGTQIFPGSDGFQSGDMGPYADRYPERSKVMVYYKPGQPEQCLLERHLWNTRNLLMLVGFVFCLAIGLTFSMGALTGRGCLGG